MEEDDDYCTKPWNGYICGAGFVLFVAGAAILGVGCQAPLTVKVDPSCKDNLQHLPCQRRVLKSSSDEKTAFKIGGAIGFTVGFIIMTIDCFTCWKCYRRCPCYEGENSRRRRRRCRSNSELLSLGGYSGGGVGASNDRTNFLTSTTTTASFQSPFAPTLTTTAATSIPSASTMLDNGSGRLRQHVRRATSDGQQWTGKRVRGVI